VTLRVTSLRIIDRDHGVPPRTNQDRRTTMRNSSSTTTYRRLLSIEETAVLLGETRSTLYRALKAGTFPLPVFRIGSRIRIPRRSVERLIDWLEPQHRGPAPHSA